MRMAGDAEAASRSAQVYAESASVAAEEAKLIARRAEQAAQKLKIEGIHRGCSPLPALPKGWLPAREIATREGLPSHGAGAKIVQSICQGLRVDVDPTMCGRYAYLNREAFALSPRAADVLRSAFLAAHRTMLALGYELRGAVMVHSPTRRGQPSGAFVVRAMLEAAVTDAGPQLALPAMPSAPTNLRPISGGLAGA
jgi:hypothetical protein